MSEELDHYKERVAKLRKGQEIPLEVGDTILVNEVESPWVNGTWEAVITILNESGHAYVSRRGQWSA